MVRRHVFAGALLLIVSLMVVPALQAQTDDNNTGYYTGTTGVGFGPVVGWYRANNADNGNLTGGAMLRIKLTPVLGVEGSLTYRQEKYSSGAVTARSWPVMVTGLIYPLPVVYGLIGAGWYFTTVTYDQVALANQNLSDETTHKFGWHFGGGVELPLGKVSLTGDIRYVFLNYNFQQVPGVGSNSNFYVINVGLLFGL